MRRFRDRIRWPWRTAAPGSPEGGETWYNSNTGYASYWDAVKGVERPFTSAQRSETVPAAYVYRSSALPITNAGNTAVTFNAERYDTDGMHDLAVNTERMTCVTPGIYQFNVFVEWAANGVGQRNLFLQHTAAIGGAVTTFAYNVYPNQGGAATTDHGVSGTFKMATGDYVVVGVAQSSTTTPINLLLCEFEATWLGGPGNVVDQIGVPACRRSQTTVAGTMAATVWTKVPLAGIPLDTDGMSATADRITIKTPGVYTIAAGIEFPTSTVGGRWLALYVNGVSQSPRANSLAGSNDGGPALSLSYEAAFVAGDYIELFSYQNSGGTVAWSGISAFLAAVRNGGNKTVTPRARAKLITSGSHTSSGNWQKVPLNTIQNNMDNDAIWDSANNQFVIKTAGTYKIDGSLCFVYNATGVRAGGVMVNNVGYGAVPAHQLQASDVSVANITGGVLDLAVGDTVQLQGWQNSGGTLAYNLTFLGPEINWLSVVKIGPSGGGAGIDSGWAANGNDLQSTNSGNIKSGGTFIGKAAAFRVGAGAGQNLPNTNTYTKMVGALPSSAVFDPYGCYDGTNKRLIIPTGFGGTWNFGYFMNCSSATGGKYTQAQVYKNGSSYASIAQIVYNGNVNVTEKCYGSWDMQVAAGDILEFYQQSDDAIALHSLSWLTGHFVGS